MVIRQKYYQMFVRQMALAFVPSSWIKELSEDEFREAMQVK